MEITTSKDVHIYDQYYIYHLDGGILLILGHVWSPFMPIKSSQFGASHGKSILYDSSFIYVCHIGS